MQGYLQDLINLQFYAFLLIFMRFGLAVMIMPGIGDSFVTAQVRLCFALALSLVLTPPLAGLMPPMPAEASGMVTLLASEALIGIFIGTIMRIMLNALDTAGAIVSLQSGFASALLFNPVSGGQGSLIGSLYAMTGITLLMVLNLHHYMLAAIIDSYSLLPAHGTVPDTGSMAEIIVRTVSTAFHLGALIAMPFIIVGLVVQVGFGVLGRLMPQIQIFFLALPAQIMISLVMLTAVLSIGLMYWVSAYENTVAQALAP